MARLLDLFCGAGGAAAGYHRAGFDDITGVDHQPQRRYPFRFVQGDALEFLASVKLGEYDAIHASPPCQGYSRMRHLPWLKGRTWLLLIEPLRERLIALGIPWVIENVMDAPLGGIVLCGTQFGLRVYRHRRFESSAYLLQPPHSPHRVKSSTSRPSSVVRLASAHPARAIGVAAAIGREPMRGDGRPEKGLPKVIEPDLGGYSEAGRHSQSKLEFGLPRILPAPRRLNDAPSDGKVAVLGHQTSTKIAGEAMGISWMTRDELCQAVPPAYTEFIGRQILGGSLSVSPCLRGENDAPGGQP